MSIALLQTNHSVFDGANRSLVSLIVSISPSIPKIIGIARRRQMNE
jgi:hypothetical protein